MPTRRKIRYGNQTPTQKVYLHRKRDTALGVEAIRLYERTGRKAQPWQEELIKAILAIDRDGTYIHSKFGYSVPRRNGKNEVITIRELYGLTTGERIMHTAHRTATSTAAFERLYDLLCAAEYEDGVDFHCTRAKGQERITFFKKGNNGVINFRTRSSKGGLGEGYDLLVIDEAQEYTEDQETALKYVVTDSRNPQTVFLGTPPTTVSAGTVFLKMRKEVLAGGRLNTGWAEWSVSKISDVHDVDLWYLANPAMGYQLNERKVADEITTDDIDFNIQRLGLWLEYNQKSCFSEPEWDALKVPKAPELVGKICAGLKFGHDGSSTALSIAGNTKDGKIFVESVDCRPSRAGMGWIIEFAQRAELAAFVIDGANGQAILAEELAHRRIRPKPILPTVKEVISASTNFEQAMEAKQICHTGQPSLRASATNCDHRPIGSNGGFGYRSIRDDVEVTLIESTVLAAWACAQMRSAAPKAKIR